MTTEKKQQKETVTNEIHKLRRLIGQLGFLAGQTKLDLPFEICHLSRCLNHSIISNIIKAYKLLRMAKHENVFFF